MLKQNQSQAVFSGYSYSHLASFISGMALLILGFFVLWLPEIDQPILTAPLVVLSIIFTIFWCLPLAYNRVDGKIDWFHPSLLILMIYLVYIVFSGIWMWLYRDYHSPWVDLGSRSASIVNYIFLMGYFSMFSFGLGLRAKTVILKKNPESYLSQNDHLNWRWVRFLIPFFFIVGGIFKYQHLSLLGPLDLDIFRYLSPSAYRNLGLEISQFSLMLESMLDWAGLLVIFYYIVRYKETGRTSGWWLVLSLTILIALLGYVIFAKRTNIIPFFLFPLIWYHYIIKRLSASQAAVYLGLGMFLIAVFLMVRIVVPFLVQDILPPVSFGQGPVEILAYYFDTPEFSTFDMVVASVVRRADLLKQAGGSLLGPLKYTFSTLIVFIPRAIWSAKPLYEDLGHVYYQVLTGLVSNAGLAPTIWGSSLLFLNLPGLMATMYITGLFLQNAYTLFNNYRNSLLAIFLYSVFYWLVFHFIRFGTLGFVLLLFVQSMVVGVFAAFLFLRKRKLH